VPAGGQISGSQLNNILAKRSKGDVRISEGIGGGEMVRIGRV